MQSKQVAVAGILTGGVITGLGVVVLVAGLTEAERPDRDPVMGYDVGDVYPDVDPLPPPVGSKPAEEPSAGSSVRPRGSATDHHGATYQPETDPSTTAGPNRPSPDPEPDEPAETGGSTPTAGPTRTAEPEPSVEPTGSADPTTDPTPTETATPTTEP